MNPGAAKRFRQNGIAVDLRQIRTLNDYRWWVRRVGEKLSCQKAAAGELERTDRLEQQLKRKKALPLKILWVVYDRPLMVAGPRSLPHQVITMMKMQNVAADVPDEYFKCSWEWILKNQPDWIIWTLPGKPQKNHRLWGNLTAVKKGRVITDIMDDPVQRMLHRFHRAFLCIMKHPEGQTGDGFRDHAHTGVHDRHLDCVSWGDRLARAAPTEGEGRRGADYIPGLVPGPEQSGEWIFHSLPPLQAMACLLIVALLA
jgi:hypothetical protein